MEEGGGGERRGEKRWRKVRKMRREEVKGGGEKRRGDKRWGREGERR